MPPNPDYRASDADRDRVAAELQEHCAQGRLTMDEMRERVDAVYEAKTMARLEELTADLPETDLHQLPVPAYQRAAAAPARREGGGELVPSAMWAGWATWAVVSGINFAIWMAIALGGELVYPWWLWVAGPWGIVLLVNTVVRPRRR